MDFSTIASNLWPSWVLGIGMIAATYKSKFKDLLTISKLSIIKWTGFLCVITILRIISLKLLLKSGMSLGAYKDTLNAVASIPWPLTLTVFWEDAMHTLPIAILAKITENKFYSKWLNRALILFTMVSFGLGHTYQGMGAAFLLSFYIPLTLKMAKKHGFGTVMVCHVLYDLFTALTIRAIMAM